MSVNLATFQFNVIWQNDQALYNAVLAYAKDMTDLTDQTLGRNVKDRVYAWANDGGWGYGPGRKFDILKHLDLTGYPQVSETEVGEAVRESLTTEGELP